MLLILLLLLLLLVLHDGEAARCWVHRHHHRLVLLAIGVVVEDAGVVVVKGDVHVQNHHRLVQLDEGLGLKVSDTFFGSLEGAFVAINFLDDL